MLNAPLDCPLCPRLAAFRGENKIAHPDFFNAPVPNWGDAQAKLLIVGLAPGLKGANRTGRPFTGDYAGDLLFATLAKAGLSNDKYDFAATDGLTLNGVMITNAVRCVPPQNKPVGAEINTCSQFLLETLKVQTQATTLICLGGIAHKAVIKMCGEQQAEFPFAHGAQHQLSNGRTIFDSYHCSRYNTNTNRLTPEMFEDVVFAAAKHAGITPE